MTLIAIVQETLTKSQCETFAVVASHSQLSLQLPLGILQLRCRQWFFHKAVKFTSHYAQALVNISGVASEIGTPHSRVTVCHHRTLNGVNKSSAFAQCDVQSRVHCRTSYYIIKKIERPAAIVCGCVCDVAYHHMCLMGAK